jgi:hypothetical protein
VQTALEAFGLKINERKSFSNGFFRESCGGDYYRGYDVTPVYLRHQCRDELHHSMAEEMMSLTATSNLLYRRGLWKTSQHLRTILDTVNGRPIPVSSYDGAGLSYFSYRWTTSCRWNDATQSYAQYRTVYDPKKVSDPSCDIGTLMRSYLGMAHSPERSLTSPLDFAKSVKRGSFKMKRRWVPATIGRYAG